MDQTIGKIMAQQQMMSTSKKTWFQVTQSLMKGPVSPMTTEATLARSWRGMTIIRTFFSRSWRKGLRKDQPVPTRTMTVKRRTTRMNWKM